MGQNIQAGTKSAADSFNKFVEGDERLAPRPGGKGPDADKQDFWDSFGASPSGPSKDKQEFWDNFGDAAQTSPTKPKTSNIGTSAMKRPGGGGAKKDDDWGEW